MNSPAQFSSISITVNQSGFTGPSLKSLYVIEGGEFEKQSAKGFVAEILLREGAFSPPVLMLRQVVACVLWNKDRYPGNLHLSLLQMGYLPVAQLSG